MSHANRRRCAADVMATPVDGRDERAGAVGGGLGSTAADFLQRCSAGVQNQFFRDAVSVEKMKVITHDLSNGASHEKVEAELALGLACHPLVLQYWGKDKVPVKIWTLGSDAAARKASQMVIESKLPRFDLVRGNFAYDEVARDGSDVSPAFPDWRKCITGAPVRFHHDGKGQQFVLQGGIILYYRKHGSFHRDSAQTREVRESFNEHLRRLQFVWKHGESSTAFGMFLDHLNEFHVIKAPYHMCFGVPALVLDLLCHGDVEVPGLRCTIQVKGFVSNPSHMASALDALWLATAIGTTPGPSVDPIVVPSAGRRLNRGSASAHFKHVKAARKGGKKIEVMLSFEIKCENGDTTEIELPPTRGEQTRDLPTTRNVFHFLERRFL